MLLPLQSAKNTSTLGRRRFLHFASPNELILAWRDHGGELCDVGA